MSTQESVELVPLWEPSGERASASNLNKFIQHINMQGEAIENYHDLHQWSVDNKKHFWLSIWQFCDVIGYKGDCIHGEGIARWANFHRAVTLYGFLNRS